MRAFRALLAKELSIYFGSPLVYLVAAAFLAYTATTSTRTSSIS